MVLRNTSVSNNNSIVQFVRQWWPKNYATPRVGRAGILKFVNAVVCGFIGFTNGSFVQRTKGSLKLKGFQRCACQTYYQSIIVIEWTHGLTRLICNKKNHPTISILIVAPSQPRRCRSENAEPEHNGVQFIPNSSPFHR